MMVAVHAYPSSVPNSGKKHLTPALVTPSDRGRTLKVSTALAIVGELTRRSAASSSSVRADVSTAVLVVLIQIVVEYSGAPMHMAIEKFRSSVHGL